MTGFSDRKKARILSGLPDSLDSRTYNLVIGGLILYGFALNALIVELFSAKLANMSHPWILIIVYFVCCIAGVFMARSQSPILSFAGYNLIVVPIGLVLAVSLPGYPKSDIMSAIIVTAAVVAAMIAVSVLKPDFFLKLGRVLFFSLIIGIVAQLVALLFRYSGGIFNWIFVVLFSLYIGYDWSRAQAYPKTLDNAVDSAVDLYLDIINLFFRILSLISRNRD